MTAHLTFVTGNLKIIYLVFSYAPQLSAPSAISARSWMRAMTAAYSRPRPSAKSTRTPSTRPPSTRPGTARPGTTRPGSTRPQTRCRSRSVKRLPSKIRISVSDTYMGKKVGIVWGWVGWCWKGFGGMELGMVGWD